ncbi:uncharacterized protein METZ01_LOCUS343054 [marine metagenome]|uniref:Uncharacterized protein n=1 Tax=marine metagenome TaxID=408172 RepID=A0A382QZ51_9ZZZZ
MKNDKFSMKKTIFTLVGSMLFGATLVILYMGLT